MTASHDKDVGFNYSFSVGSKQLNFINDDGIVFRSGNNVVILSIAKREQSIIKMDEGLTLDAMAINPSNVRHVHLLHGFCTLVYKYIQY